MEFVVIISIFNSYCFRCHYEMQLIRYRSTEEAIPAMVYTIGNVAAFIEHVQ